MKVSKYCEVNNIRIEQEVTIDPYDLIFADIVLKGKKAVIEINGPFHYLQGDSQKPLLADLLNQKIIESFGYKIITVNIDNFNHMPDEDKQMVYQGIIDSIN